jgi:hypothetical protein
MPVFGVPTKKETKAKIRKAEEMALGSKATPAQAGKKAGKGKDAPKKKAPKKRSPYSNW